MIVNGFVGEMTSSSLRTSVNYARQALAKERESRDAYTYVVIRIKHDVAWVFVRRGSRVRQVSEFIRDDPTGTRRPAVDCVAGAWWAEKSL